MFSHHAVAKNLRINFCWVLGHVGIARNEKADTTVKEAAINERYPTFDKVIHHTYIKIKKTIKDENGKTNGSP